MPKAFVTGGTGFVGSHLVETLLKDGVEVRALVRSDPKWLEGLDVEFVRGDLHDREVLLDALRGVDEVYHVAGVTRAPSEEAFRRANVEGTATLLEAVQEAAPGAKVLVTSSLAAIGRCEDGVADETTPLRPVSRYGQSKAEMEALVRERFGALDWRLVRPPSVYGPREADIYTQFKSAARGVFPMTGPARRPYLSLVYVTDLVRGMIEAARHPDARHETYFIGSEAPVSWHEVKQAMMAALGRRALMVAVPEAFVGLVGAASEVAGKVRGTYPPLNREKAREIRHTCKMCTSDKAMRELGYAERVSLDEGMRRTVAWYRANGWL